jgi:hypothetical protein
MVDCVVFGGVDAFASELVDVFKAFDEISAADKVVRVVLQLRSHRRAGKQSARRRAVW